MNHAVATSPLGNAARRRLAWLCLLSFALRALVPTGFMLSAADGALSLVVCDGSVPAATVTAAHAHHHHAGATAGAATGTDRNAPDALSHAGHHAAGSQCPFALANAAGLAAASTPVLPALQLEWRAPRLTAAHQISVVPPFRFSAPRGPPSPV